MPPDFHQVDQWGYPRMLVGSSGGHGADLASDAIMLLRFVIITIIGVIADAGKTLRCNGFIAAARVWPR
jgi:hypothetical protein